MDGRIAIERTRSERLVNHGRVEEGRSIDSHRELSGGSIEGKSTGVQERRSKWIRAGYELLHLETYFTVGLKEARTWTIKQGTGAPQAAGVIHGDFERGFIRAETIAYDDYVALKGEQGAKEAGKMRSEGKSYVVKDGDVLHFLFNT